MYGEAAELGRVYVSALKHREGKRLMKLMLGIVCDQGWIVKAMAHWKPGLDPLTA